jgi:hypothetical protein
MPLTSDSGYFAPALAMSDACNEHLTLAYDAWAPVGDDGIVRDDERPSQPEALANIAATRITRSSWSAGDELHRVR